MNTFKNLILKKKCQYCNIEHAELRVCPNIGSFDLLVDGENLNGGHTLWIL